MNFATDFDTEEPTAEIPAQTMLDLIESTPRAEVLERVEHPVFSDAWDVEEPTVPEVRR